MRQRRQALPRAVDADKLAAEKRARRARRHRPALRRRADDSRAIEQPAIGDAGRAVRPIARIARQRHAVARDRRRREIGRWLRRRAAAARAPPLPVQHIRQHQHSLDPIPAGNGKRRRARSADRRDMRRIARRRQPINQPRLNRKARRRSHNRAVSESHERRGRAQVLDAKLAARRLCNACAGGCHGKRYRVARCE